MDPVSDSPSRLRATVEVVVLIGLMVATKSMLDPLTWRYSGPIALAVTVLAAHLLLRNGGESWRTLGLDRGGINVQLVWQVPLAIVLSVGASLSVAWALGDVMSSPETAATRFGDLAGNLPGVLWWVSISWLIGGFAEEMLFRGFLLNRLERSFGGGRLAIWLAVAGQATLFGAAHIYYKGLLGGLVTAAAALVLGALYIAYRRNLWPLVLAHGFVNSIAFVAQYFGIVV